MNAVAPLHGARAWELDPSIEQLIRSIEIDEDDDGMSAQVAGATVTAPGRREFSRELASHFYVAYHAGTSTDGQEYIPSLQQDSEFEARLVEATAFTSRRAVLAVSGDIPAVPGVVVALQGLQVHFPADRILARRGPHVEARVPSLEPRLSIGFMFYTTRCGGGSLSRPLRLYRRITTADEAVEVWRRLIDWAEAQHLPLRAKILSRATAFPRNDALVVYLPSEAWRRTAEVVDLLSTGAPGTVTSAFARQLGGDVAMAWEPHDPSGLHGRISFGEHRSALLARGIVAAEGDADRAVELVRLELLDANVDPSKVHRNLDSPPTEGWIS